MQTLLSPHRLTTSFLTALLALILGSALALIVPLSAQAHDQLVEADPTANAELSTAPDAIVLTYSNSLITIGNVVEVVNADGENIATAELQVSGPKITQPLPTDAPDGWYLVNWRAVSSDGHPITGSHYYLVGSDSSLPKPAQNPEFVDEHDHEHADDDHSHDHGDEGHDHGDHGDDEHAHDHDHAAETPADGSDSTQQILLYGSLAVAGIGIGALIFWFAMRKKPKA